MANYSAYSLWLKHVATASLTLILVACNSSSSPKKPAATGTGGAVADPGAVNVECIRGNCPAVSVEVSATGSSGGVMSVTIGSLVSWSFTATSVQAPSRVFKVFDIVASTQPSTMQIDGQKSPSVRVAWTPAATDSTSGTLTASVRDVTMCEMTAPTTTNCNNDFTTTGAWDSTQTLSWQITNPTTTTANNGVLGTGSSGGFLQILMSVGLPLIQSMMSGGDMDFSSILGSMSGLFSGGLGGAGGGLSGLGTGLTGLQPGVVPVNGIGTTTNPLGTGTTTNPLGTGTTGAGIDPNTGLPY